MRVYTEIIYEWDGEKYIIASSKWHEYDGPVALCCGASSEQKGIEAKQASFFDTITQQAQNVFGDSSSVFKDLVSSFAPIVAAGPNQRGFSGAEHAALETQATEGTARAYEHASKAVNEQMAARGGGNAFIPSGADDQRQQEMAASAAGQESDQKLGIEQADYATGRENYFKAAAGLAQAPGVFNPAVGFDNAATSAGSAASETANQIAQEDNSWVGAVTGALGGIAGAAVTGGFGAMGRAAKPALTPHVTTAIRY